LAKRDVNKNVKSFLRLRPT